MLVLASSTPLPFGQTVLLGAIAGSTIFLGLPLGRMRALGMRGRVALAMFSVGILLFIFMDVGSHAETIISNHLDAYKHSHGSFATVVGLFLLLGAGFLTGVAGIPALERQIRLGWRRAGALEPPPVAGGSAELPPIGPQQTVVLGGDGLRATAAVDQKERRALQTGITVAVAIGLHNFAEGLAIGVSAASGAIALATVLIIGFGAHNATEGFGIVGPLGEVRPSWRWLALAGLIGGGPTFLGTIVGYQVTSAPLELLFYSLAAGALVYVIGEVWTGMRKYGHRELAMLMLGAGFLAGVLTDLIVSYGGA